MMLVYLFFLFLFVIVLIMYLYRGKVEKILFEAEKKELLENDKKVMRDFAENEFFRYSTSAIFTDFVSASIAYKKSKKNKDLFKSVRHFENKFSLKISSYINEIMSDMILEEFAYSLVEVMESHKFEEQPSVNVKLIDDDTPFGIPVTLSSHKEFAKINLLEHTCNIVEQLSIWLKNTRHSISDIMKDQLVLCCILHDFGKSIELAKKFDLYHEGMNNGKYKHAELSKMMGVKFFDSEAGALLKELDMYDAVRKEVLDAVERHHSKGSFLEPTALSKILIEVDHNARRYEEKILEKRKKDEEAF